MKRICKKLCQQIGESLIETLAALLIAALGLTLLPGAIVAAARVNHRAEQISFAQTQGASTPVSATISLTPDGGSALSEAIDVYSDSEGNYYYVKKD